MARRSQRWRTRRSPATPGRRRHTVAGIRKRDWLKLLLVVGAILWLGLGEPLSQLDRLLGYFGFR